MTTKPWLQNTSSPSGFFRTSGKQSVLLGSTNRVFLNDDRKVIEHHKPRYCHSEHQVRPRRVHQMHVWQMRARPTPRIRRRGHMNMDCTIAQGTGRSHTGHGHRAQVSARYVTTPRPYPSTPKTNKGGLSGPGDV
jgi:hypothetical protein